MVVNRPGKTTLSALLLLCGLSLAGCQTTQDSILNKEDLLSAAGFVPQMASTPQRLAAMRKLPPNKFVQQTRNNQVFYVYADPVVCMCVYLGDQGAYANYRNMVFQKQIADERQLTAQMNATAIDFDFDPWMDPIWPPQVWGYPPPIY